MKIKLSLLSLFFCFFACKESNVNSHVERISLNPINIVSDSIESVMPGSVHVLGDYILWTDPFNADKYVHILDAKSGKELGQIVKRGEGPDEFVTPSIIMLPKDQVFIFDSNTGKIAIQSIKSAIQGDNSFILKELINLTDVTAATFIENEEVIFFNPAKSKPFSIYPDPDGAIESFGKLPFKEEVDRGRDYFQGPIGYNSINKHFVYSTIRFPYYAVYKKEGKSFKLKNEILNIEDYRLKDGNFIYKGNARGAFELALTSDYIVTLERDRKFDQTDNSKVGRDFTKLPRTIFLYDYDFQLKKIVDLGMPVLRIGADPINNTLYIIGANPDFMLYKYVL